MTTQDEQNDTRERLNSGVINSLRNQLANRSVELAGAESERDVFKAYFEKAQEEIQKLTQDLTKTQKHNEELEYQLSSPTVDLAEKNEDV